MMKRILTTCCYGFVLIVALLQSVYARNISDQIDDLIDTSLPHATVGVVIKDAQTNEVVYQKNANKLLTPASISKLYTAASALYQLSPSYQYVTTLSQQDNNYYITFTGSPSFTVREFENLLGHLKHQHITEIEGDIILDISRFASPVYPAATAYDDLGWYYAAPDSALVLNENAEKYTLFPAKRLGDKVTIQSDSTRHALKLINQVTTASAIDAKQHCNLNIDILPHNTLKLYGCLASKPAHRVMNFSIPDPVYWAEQVIKQSLEVQGIRLKGQIKTGITPTDATCLAEQKSEELTQLITHMLHVSDNLYANSLFKLLGYALTGEGSYKQGEFAVKQILSKHTHLDMDLVELVDGAGARYNLMTPWQTTVLLSDLYHNEALQPIMLKALPIAGVSGNLSDRFKKTPLENKVFAKTGTMHDVSSLAGYLRYNKEKTFIFTMITNGAHVPIIQVKKLEEQILQMIYKHKIDDNLANAS